jgi:hypothetical protein
MKKLFVVAALALIAGLVLRAQISPASPSISAIPSTALAVNCPAPTVGYTIYCTASDKFQVSANGAAYVVIWPSAPPAAGVTSISINGGAPVSGAVSFTIPSKAVSTTTTNLQ